MKNSITKTVNVCRIGIGHLDIQVEVPADATQAEIEAAAIERAGSEVFSDSNAEYSITDNTGETANGDRQQLQALLQGLADLGFGTSDTDINGADAVDAIAVLFEDMVDPERFPSGPRASVIHSPSREGDQPQEREAYWNSTTRDWVDLENATRFFVPMNAQAACGAADAQLIPLIEAKAKEAQPD